MLASEILSVAEEVLEAHRQTLFMDPFIKIDLGVLTEDSKASRCIKSSETPLSWEIKLNIDKHQDMYDVHYSIFEGLLTIIFSQLDRCLESDRQEVTLGIVNRLAATLSSHYDEDIEEEDPLAIFDDEEYYDEED